MNKKYHNHDIEGYIDYHDIRYILHITKYYCTVRGIEGLGSLALQILQKKQRN